MQLLAETRAPRYWNRRTTMLNLQIQIGGKRGKLKHNSLK
jgi:hypothetical protein